MKIVGNLKEIENSYQKVLQIILNENREIDFNNLRITFNWEEEEYNTFATTLFLVRNQE
ncbi:MAG: hypothetical protein M5T52_06625 [Ignavibacteriaceae bacterium]|nr:hypothetical protein [Ignavibacteriaceae bacterium]